jgi:hypothetical protein
MIRRDKMEAICLCGLKLIFDEEVKQFGCINCGYVEEYEVK